MKQSENKTSKLFRSIYIPKIIKILFILLLIGLIILVFNRISHVFAPVKVVLTSIALPIILAGIAYYLLNPLVDLLEKYKLKRGYSILILFVLIIGLITFLIVAIVPFVKEQITGLIDNLPFYGEEIQRLFEVWIGSDLYAQIQSYMGLNTSEIWSNLSARATTFFNNTFKGIGTVVGAVTEVVLSLIIAPFVLVYLLKDGKKLPHYILNMVPVKNRGSIFKVLSEINHQLSSFIRGQLIVSFCIGCLLYIGYLIIGLEYPLALAIIAAFTSVVPYLGPTIAITPAIIVALVTSPIMLIKMIVVWTVVQLIEGKFISPQIMGKTLRIHPITIIFVILSAGKIFGVLGIILALPGYAVLKVIVMNLFGWFKATSGLYEPPADGEAIVLDTDKP